MESISSSKSQNLPHNPLVAYRETKISKNSFFLVAFLFQDFFYQNLAIFPKGSETIFRIIANFFYSHRGLNINTIKVFILQVRDSLIVIFNIGGDKLELTVLFQLDHVLQAVL